MEEGKFRYNELIDTLEEAKKLVFTEGEYSNLSPCFGLI